MDISDARQGTAEGMARKGRSHGMAQGAQLEARRTQGCQAQLQSEIAPRCEAALSGGRECLWTWERMLKRTVVIWDKLG